MELAKPIELAPKNGDFVVLQDGCSGSWEVGRWTLESSSWVQLDGKPLRIFPTHWVPVSGDTAGSENTEGLSFLVPPIQMMESPPKRLHTRFILAFTVAAIFIGGYAAFDFGFTGAGPAKDSSFDKIVGSATELKGEVSGERDAANLIVRNLAAGREEIALHIGREDALQAEAPEARRMADAKQRELKQALDESEARAEALSRELTSVREKFASVGKSFNKDVFAQDGASPTKPLDRAIQESNAGMTGVVPITSERSGAIASFAGSALPDRNVQSSGAKGSWIISETLSPVDYSPMITAATLSQSNAKDAPATFAIRCRGQRTDLLVGTEGSWRASRVRELQIDYRVNEQPAVRMQWIASADGRTALFKDDVVRFLRSLPDSGRITVRVFDQGPAHEVTFQLTGLDAVRQKIGVACKWAPPDRISPAGR
jgi:hypothetical protein